MNLKYIFIILFIILQVPCQAQQEMSVAGFKLLENDLTAMRQGTQKEDVNGNAAALIKIVTILAQFKEIGRTYHVCCTQAVSFCDCIIQTSHCRFGFYHTIQIVEH